MQKYLILKIPVIDTGETSEQKIEKMKEEIDELLSEFCAGKVETFAALSEMFDVVQVMAGYLLAHTRETILDNVTGSHDYVETILSNANQLHISKMLAYAKDRKWQMVNG